MSCYIVTVVHDNFRIAVFAIEFRVYVTVVVLLLELTVLFVCFYTLFVCLFQLESSKSVLITQQSESEKQLTFKLKSDYEARIATLQTEKLQELEVVKQKNDSLLKTSIAKAIESGKEEARQLFDLEIEEMKRGMEEMRDEIGDERREKEEKEKELKLMKKMVDNIRRELEEEKHKMVSNTVVLLITYY